VELLGDEELNLMLPVEKRLPVKKRKQVEAAKDPNAEETYKQIIAYDQLEGGVNMGEEPTHPNTYLRQQSYKDWKKRNALVTRMK
jgi:hypothetical protein